MRIPTLALALCLTLPLLFQGGRAQGEDAPSERVIHAAVQAFLEAVKAQSPDAVMKTVDVPWFHMGEEVIKERDKLKSEFDALFRRRTFSDLRYEILKTAAYELIRERTTAEERQLLDAVLGPKDAVVLISMDTQMNRNRKVVLLVRSSGKEAKVVGLKE